MKGRPGGAADATKYLGRSLRPFKGANGEEREGPRAESWTGGPAAPGPLVGERDEPLAGSGPSPRVPGRAPTSASGGGREGRRQARSLGWAGSKVGSFSGNSRSCDRQTDRRQPLLPLTVHIQVRERNYNK